MVDTCYCCKRPVGIFYVWSTSRRFPKEELIYKLDITDKNRKAEIKSHGVKVCFKCLNELKG